MSKEIRKSLRLSEDVVNYINSFPGESFSRKFENVVISCKDRDERLKRVELEELQKRIEDNRDFIVEIVNLQKMAQRIDRQFSQLSEEISQHINYLMRKSPDEFVPPEEILPPSDMPFG